jgi:mannose-6-phosphate isomerase
MALALTPFRALCGFLPLPRIATYLRSTPEFAALIPPNIRDAFLSISSTSTPTGPAEKTALRNLFAALMTAEEVQIRAQLSKLVARYQAGDVHEDEEGVSSLVLRLHSQFPGDIGVFCPFMLNYIRLEPGQAIFLGAGEPHAYISGGTCLVNLPTVKCGLTGV